MKLAVVVVSMMVALASAAQGQTLNPEVKDLPPPPEQTAVHVLPTGSVSTASADLTPGDKAPDFQLDSSLGSVVRLADLKGHWSALVFDQSRTMVCLAPAIVDSIRAMGVQPFGVCRDGVNSLKSYARREQLHFPLLSDPTGQISQLFSMYDDTNEAIRSGLVIVDATGVVRMVIQGPALHPNDVLQMVQHVVRGS